MKESIAHLCAVNKAENKVYLSWRLSDDEDLKKSFRVERRRPDEEWKAVSDIISDSQDYTDTVTGKVLYEYRLVEEGMNVCSETVSVDASKVPQNVAFRLPLPCNVEDYALMACGDLDNDGIYDFAVRYTENGKIKLAGVSASGKKLWGINTGLPAAGGWDGSSHHCPFICYDIDNDGRCEIVYHSGENSWLEDGDVVYEKARPGEKLIIADGETGKTKYEYPWPAEKPRVMMTVGHLDGPEKPASVVVLDETYGDVVLTAFKGDGSGKKWTINQKRAAGHNLDVGDVNLDGVQEVVCGGICYRGDGSKLWEAEEFGHTDMSKPANIWPERSGLETWYLVESNNPGVYLVDSSGKTIFKEKYSHAHFGWIAKHTTEAEGLQEHAAEDRREKTNEEHHPIFLNDGTHWLGLTNEQSRDLMPVQWDGGERTVFVHRKKKKIVAVNKDGTLSDIPGGKLVDSGRYARNLICADLIGDYRANIATIDKESGEIVVLQNTEPLNKKKISPMSSFYYRHDRSQHGSGYYMYVPPHDGADV
ncbi:MAG: hypothetical protein ACLFQK_04595 [Fibrobacterota bacterium]